MTTSPESSDSGFGRDAAGVSFADAKAGDAILFDYRVLHRGLANTTEDVARPLLYFTYGRAWFTDATNYSALSIYDAAEETS